jgi:hypothetical protein
VGAKRAVIVSNWANPGAAVLVFRPLDFWASTGMMAHTKKTIRARALTSLILDLLAVETDHDNRHLQPDVPPAGPQTLNRKGRE